MSSNQDKTLKLFCYTFLGTQFLMVVLSFFTSYYPEDINRSFGYRTRMSMQSVEHWHAGNLYFSQKFQLSTILGFLLDYTFIKLIKNKAWVLFLIIAILVCTFVIPITLTEDYLNTI